MVTTYLEVATQRVVEVQGDPINALVLWRYADDAATFVETIESFYLNARFVAWPPALDPETIPS